MANPMRYPSKALDWQLGWCYDRKKFSHLRTGVSYEKRHYFVFHTSSAAVGPSLGRRRRGRAGRQPYRPFCLSADAGQGHGCRLVQNSRREIPVQLCGTERFQGCRDLPRPDPGQGCCHGGTAGPVGPAGAGLSGSRSHPHHRLSGRRIEKRPLRQESAAGGILVENGGRAFPRHILFAVL